MSVLRNGGSGRLADRLTGQPNETIVRKTIDGTADERKAGGLKRWLRRLSPEYAKMSPLRGHYLVCWQIGAAIVLLIGVMFKLPLQGIAVSSYAASL